MIINGFNKFMNREIFKHGEVKRFSEEEELKELSDKGFASWKNKFTWEKIAKQYETLYQTLIQTK